MRTNPDEEPLIALGVGSYQHSNRAYGEIRYPILKVVGWVPLAELPALNTGLLSSDSSQQTLAPPKPPQITNTNIPSREVRQTDEPKRIETGIAAARKEALK
jgi:hypothetical protein